MILKAIIPLALIFQGLGVNTPVIFNFLPDYRRIFLRLWQRHKNPVSWVCRPFFGLILGYGAILENWLTILIGLLGLGTSWFWFPGPQNPPLWAEQFINQELEVLTPGNHRDFKRVILPSIGLPLGLAVLITFLWRLDYPWNWVCLGILVIVSILKIAWSARLESSVFKPIIRITLLGFCAGVIIGTLLFVLQG